MSKAPRDNERNGIPSSATRATGDQGGPRQVPAPAGFPEALSLLTQPARV